MHIAAARPALLLLSILLAVLQPWPTAAGAGEAEIAYGAGHADATGMVVVASSGATGCLAGCASLQLAPGRAIPRGQSLVRFAVPAGTMAVGGEVIVRYRTRHAAVSVRMLQRHGGRWVDGRRLRSASGGRTAIPVPKGAEEIALALRVEQPIPARAVRGAADNRLAVEAVRLRVRDLEPPTVRWAEAPPEGAGWQRGIVCGVASSTDRGLGVSRIEYAIGEAEGVLDAPAGTRLQPSPAELGGRICVDTAALEDGAYGTELHAIEHGPDATRSAAVRGGIRVDNTAPAVELASLPDPEERLPELRLLVDETASGVRSAEVAIAGEPLTARPVGDGTWTARVARPLGDGAHRVTWTFADAAGNVATGAAVVAIADTTPPTISEPAPTGAADPWAALSVRVVDRGAGVSPDAIRVAVDGVDATALLDIEGERVVLSPAGAWAPGEHRVRVAVVDRSGNRAVHEWSFHVPAPEAPADPQPSPAPSGDLEETRDPDGEEPGALRLTRLGTGAIRRAPASLRIEARRDDGPAAGLRLRVAWAGGAAIGDAIVDDAGVAVIRLTRLRRGTLIVRGGGAELSLAIRPAPRIRLTADRRQVAAGQRVRLSGRVEGAAGSATIEVLSGGRWLAVATVPVGSGGRFATPVVVPAAGAYSVRARSGAALSPVVRLTAR